MWLKGSSEEESAGIELFVWVGSCWALNPINPINPINPKPYSLDLRLFSLGSGCVRAWKNAFAACLWPVNFVSCFHLETNATRTCRRNPLPLILKPPTPLILNTPIVVYYSILGVFNIRGEVGGLILGGEDEAALPSLELQGTSEAKCLDFRRLKLGEC